MALNKTRDVANCHSQKIDHYLVMGSHMTGRCSMVLKDQRSIRAVEK